MVTSTLSTRLGSPEPLEAERFRKANAEQVIRDLETYCSQLAPGTRIPSRNELMLQFNASQRSVLKALDELQRSGRLVIRNGSGTYVAEFKAPDVKNAGLVNNRTILAIAKPDRSVFDQAMSTLYQCVENEQLSLACRFVDGPDQFGPTVPHSTDSPCGYIVFRHDFQPLAKRLLDAGHRVVLVGALDANALPDVPNVFGDQEQGGYLATQHLLELGHRKLAFFGDSRVMRTQRWSGHQRALREARRSGLEFAASYFNLEEIELWRGDLARARAYFASPEAPTGIVAWNDHEAVGLLTLMQRIGVRVPEDVSLVGYDNLPEGRHVHPTLTTLDTALTAQVKAALSLLTREVPAPATFQTVVMPTLIRRESTLPVPANC